MKNVIRSVIGFLGVLAVSWGLLVGLFTWDSSRIYPAYESAAKTLFKPIVAPIIKAFENVIGKADR